MALLILVRPTTIGASGERSVKTQSSLKVVAYSVAAIAGVWFLTAIRAADSMAKIEGKNIRIEFDNRMHSRVIARFDGKEIPLGPFSASETVTVDGNTLEDFALSGNTKQNVRDNIGAGRQTTLTGTSGAVQKTLMITVYDSFPQMAFFKVRYTNKGKADVKVTGWSNNRYAVTAGTGGAEPPLWSYESGSYQKRPDWVVPLKAGFKQENYLGMNSTDYGGGTPVVDVWRRDAGLGIGHVELTAKLVSMPVEMPDGEHATLALSFHPNQAVGPGESVDTFRSFAAVHQGDYFRTLRNYSGVMQAEGVHLQS